MTENLLIQHQTEKHELVCLCGICKQGFQSLKELGDHFKIHELQPNSLEKIHNKSFVKKSVTVKKTNQSSKTSPKLVPKAHVCSICDETFEKADELALHVSKVHEETITDNQDTHNEVFTEATFNQSNLGEANSKARRKCDFCDKTFKSPSGRATHMSYRPESCINIVKAREKPLGCAICWKGFANAEQLAIHVKIHASPKKCKFCKKYFSKGENHEKLCKAKSYKGEDSEYIAYKCNICSKSYSREKLLDLHLQFKHKIGDKNRKTNACQFCPKHFLNKHFLDEHIQNKHHS